MQPRDEVYWFRLASPLVRPLAGDVSADVAIVGGGVAGLMCAQAFLERGRSVVLLERDHCGAGASGKSSAFVGPSSELELFELRERYGDADAKRLWDFARGGADAIRRAIQAEAMECGYEAQDSLFLAADDAGWEEAQEEHAAHADLGYPSRLYGEAELASLIGAQDYRGGTRYGGTFGMVSYLYCRHLKAALERAGAQVYEGTAATAVETGRVVADGGSVRAKSVVACADAGLPDLGLARTAVHHVQTFLAVSRPLSPAVQAALFPERVMAWESSLIYHYLRLHGDRLLLGGADLAYTYIPAEIHESRRIARKFERYLQDRFPGVPVALECLWPGQIGVTPDFLPACGPDPDRPGVYLAGAGAGLAWAAALGQYVCEKILDGRGDLDAFLSPEREMPAQTAQKLVGKTAAFALSHLVKTT